MAEEEKNLLPSKIEAEDKDGQIFDDKSLVHWSSEVKMASDDDGKFEICKFVAHYL